MHATKDIPKCCNPPSLPCTCAAHFCASSFPCTVFARLSACLRAAFAAPLNIPHHPPPAVPSAPPPRPPRGTSTFVPASRDRDVLRLCISSLNLSSDVLALGFDDAGVCFAGWLVAALVLDELIRGVAGREEEVGGLEASCFSMSPKRFSSLSSLLFAVDAGLVLALEVAVLFLVAVAVVGPDACGWSSTPRESRSLRRSSPLRAILSAKNLRLFQYGLELNENHAVCKGALFGRVGEQASKLALWPPASSRFEEGSPSPWPPFDYRAFTT